MASLFTILYIVLNHLSPADVIPSLAPYHLQLWLGMLALISAAVSVTIYSYPFRAPENLLMAGFVVAIALSNLVHGWFGGVAYSFSVFGPSILAFFACAASIRSPRHFTILTSALTVVAVYLSARAVLAYHFGYSAESFLHGLEFGSRGVIRVRGLGVLSDPNDFSQFLLVVLAFTWLAWRKRAVIRNTLFVLMPAAVITYAIFRTQSRGALVGLAALVLGGVRKRLGNMGGVVVTAGVLSLMIYSGYLSQRQSGLAITADSSAQGRVLAWGSGLAMLKSEPVFGVGFSRFGDLNSAQESLTAHNSFVLCLAELGFAGYLFWLALLTCTWLDLSTITSKVKAGDERTTGVLRWAEALRLSLLAFLVTSWFLSRTYILTLYVLLGCAVALMHYANRTAGAEFRTPPGRLVAVTGAMALCSVFLVYFFIKLRGLM